MILKESDEKGSLDKFQAFGQRAEKQMAFYLKRAFQENDKICVINDLRIEKDGDIAQIDHLIVHSYGFIVIESKSVTSEISVNDYGEWSRCYQQQNKGMPSPVEQAKRQAQFLLDYLVSNESHLIRKALIFQSSFTNFKFDVLVAISDSGIINRPKKIKIEEVYKADQIVEKISALVKGYSGVNEGFLSLKVNYSFHSDSKEKIEKFLVGSHSPAKVNTIEEPKKLMEAKPAPVEAKPVPVEVKPTPAEVKPAPTEIKKTDVVRSCSKCQSEKIEILYGKYGYYFKCTDCSGNTAIKLKCNKDSCKPRIRKEKYKFFQECKSCETSTLYFGNQNKKPA